MVEGYVPAGFSVLAGRQKLGKSRMALDFAIAVGTGGLAMNWVGCDVGDVLVLDLENGEARIQRRVEEIYPDPDQQPDLSRIAFHFEAPHLDDGLLDVLDAWRASRPDPRLIVIDVLQRVKPARGSPSQNAYERDYACFAPLQRWATEHGIAVLGLHHTRKGAADDPLEALSGSNGLSAVADTTLVLDKTGEGATLYVRFRDVEETTSALVNVNGCWQLAGDAEHVRGSDISQRIRTVLAEADGTLTPQEVADLVEGEPIKPATVRKYLTRMTKTGEVEKVGHGAYRLGHDT